ncbi:hypothetical protein L6452_19225 [Arctium lappa]|uniref:Uncharacterized protein n=1 Tax=Arctium lappa TaxID=4217 RepID=A0ACB9B8U7_ARCLA|nr:hypothetical protein L6452_19225 [Arctium lappa]
MKFKTRVQSLALIPIEEQGYYRRGAAYLAMGKFKEALKDFQQIFSYLEDYPRSSVAVSGNRKFGVYMGIDVFGRGTYGGGQWTTNVALDVLKKDYVSAAIFASGWVYKTKQPPDYCTFLSIPILWSLLYCIYKSV